MARGGIVLVTGVGQGFGRSIALGWGRVGYDVVCADRDVELAAKTAAEVEEVGGQAIPIQTDVTTPMDVREAFSKVDELFGELEGVVHVATRHSAGDPATLGDGAFRELVDETLLSSHLVLRMASRRLEDGWVVVVGPPTSARTPQDRMARMGLEGLLAGYDAGTGPRSNLILPSRPAADPRHDVRLVRTALFLGSSHASGIHGATVEVELPPPPRVVERLLPEIQAALDDRVRQDDLEADLVDDPDGDAEPDGEPWEDEDLWQALEELDRLDAHGGDLATDPDGTAGGDDGGRNPASGSSTSAATPRAKRDRGGSW